MTYLGCNCDKTSLELSRGDLGNSISGVDGGLKREHVCKETSNVRRCHRCTRDGVDSIFASSPGRLDVLARCKDVVALAEVGKVSSFISQVASTN